ncbi:HNH endonuclease signature motif containing protein, partial [Nocardioides koreensis]|uniref:HNH endonuclease signature motif containing protein n=1 Tax=Nocardioides koreensis TaxID=433651 RepID=UPI0031CFA4F6
HTDHARPRADGGDTSAHNGQGLCESCNYLKENPGWQHHPASGPMEPHAVDITTPTGHRHRSTAPPPPLPPPRRPGRPRVDIQRTRLTLIA